MTLATAVLGGLLCGYFFGLRRRPLAVFFATWLAVLVFQTLALDPADVPPQAWEYVPVQAVILGIGLGMVWVGAKVRARFGTPDSR